MEKTSRFSIGGWIGGLLLPIVSFIYALFHPKNKDFKLQFVLFHVFVGTAAFYVIGSTSDIATYVDDFNVACSLKGIGLLDYYHSRPEAQQIDYYSTFMLWLVSRVTSEARVFLGSLALVYALFFASNVCFLIDRIKTNRMNILLLIVFIVVPRIFMLTHRWWTALQVFLFGLLPVVYEKKYWKLLWCFVAAFIFHFSFLYPLIIMVISLLLPKKVLWIYLVLYIFSVFVNSFDFNALMPFINNLFSNPIVNRTESYVNFELQDHNSFSQSARIAMNIANVVLCTIIYFFNKKNLKDDDRVQRFFVTALFIGSFASLASLTEWGWRYLDLSNMVFVAFYLLYLSDDARYQENLQLFKWVSPLFLYFIVFQIRGFFFIIGPYQFLFGNYLTTWFIDDTTNIMGLIHK